MSRIFASQWVTTGIWTLLLASWAIAQEAPPPATSQPMSPDLALANFRLAESELKIELAAAEPEVVDPVAIRFDELGRMWVVEMRDYPLGPPPGEPPLSRIKILKDTDLDGKYETATIFADKLSFVTGLQPWKGGVIVTLAGRIAWMKDTSGDDKVDVDETWYTGFAEQNSQLRANHPRLALDNHVYVANGLRGGTVVNKRLPDEKPINLQGRDFRFDPLTGKAEAVSGNGQFGLCFDDWGNRFTCTNRNPVIHVVLEDRYLKLAPKIPIPAVVQDVAAAAEKSKVYPISRAWTTSNLHAGTFTAACGVHVYRGDTLSKVLGDNSVFTCDPTGNFVHREVMKPDGPSFTSTPAYEGKEFLASLDEWFRPVNIETGPDGCLYIVDMYRAVIEHPDFVPDELKKRPDLRLGDDKGRIWRIVPGTGVPANRLQEVSLSEVQPTLLTGKLAHTNGWQRDTAQRLLLEFRQTKVEDTNLTELLRNVALRDESPLARIHALWLLKGIDRLRLDVLVKSAEHKDPRVCRQSLLIADGIAPEDATAVSKSLQAYRGLTSSLRFQNLLFEVNNLKAASPRFELSSHFSEDAKNRWLRAAMLLRYHRNLADFYWEMPRENIESERLGAEIAQIIGRSGSDEELAIMVKRACPLVSVPHNDSLGDALVFDAFATGLQTRGKRLQQIVDDELRDNKEKSLGYLSEYLRAIAADAKASVEYRVAALRALGHLQGTDHWLAEFIASPSPQLPELQVAAIASLAQRGEESASRWKSLLHTYTTQPLSIQRALIDNSFRRADGPALLLEQVKAGVIQPAEIDPLRRKNLLESKDAAIKKLAGELFAALNPANRQQALDDYQPVLKLAADAKKGAVIFEKNCSTCHRVGEIGVNVAPDISDTRTKTAAQLLADIIQPNRAIDSNFIGYQVLLKDGTTITGLLSAETSTSLTLKQPGGKVVSVSRDEVEAIKATGVSLMPDGLEKNIPPEAMADLLAYLKNWRYLDGKTPLGK